MSETFDLLILFGRCE